MLKLVIADDEQIVLDGMEKIIDWHAHGVEIVGLCRNGLDAFDTILDESPDIVITDIKMPGLSGLELIAKVKGIDPGVQFIVLSGFADFEYAKQAMIFGVKHYLLKPCGEDQILESVRCAANDIENLESYRIAKEKQKLLETQIQNLALKSLFWDLLCAEEPADILAKKYAPMLGVGGGAYDLLLIDPFESWQASSLWDVLQRQKIKALAELTVVFVGNQNLGTVILESQKEDFYRQIQTEIPFAFGRKTFDTWEQLLEFLAEKAETCDSASFISPDGKRDRILYHPDVFERMKICNTVWNPENGKQTQEKVKEKIENIFLGIKDPELARVLAYKILEGKNRQQPEKWDLNRVFSQIEGNNSSEEILLWVLNLVKEYFEPAGSLEKRKDEVKFVEKLQSYVQENLADPRISLKWLAENYLFMNVDYVSREFVRQTGEKFSAFLNRTRMERAKELLRENREEKIYNVAQQVGCGNNPQYFGQLFKKYTNMTPSEYVKELSNDPE